MLIVPVIPGMNMMMFWPTVREIGREKVVSYQHELVTKELRAYIEGWEKSVMKKYDQRYRTWLLEKYGGLSLYNIYIERRYTIYYEDIKFLKKYGYALIGNP